MKKIVVAVEPVIGPSFFRISNINLPNKDYSFKNGAEAVIGPSKNRGRRRASHRPFLFKHYSC